MEILNICNVTKNFGATTALKDVSLKFYKGEVHSLVGRNGAGKSTLVNIIAGTVQQSSGTVNYEDRDISKLSVHDRQKTGIRIVTQHAAVIPELSVAENIFLGLWPKKKTGMINWQDLNKVAEEELFKYGLDVDVKKKAKYLTPVNQRKVNIVRALFGGGKLIILDEPTTSLTRKERENLFTFVLDLCKTGTSFIFITHYMDEVMKLSDHITVLRDGEAFNGLKKEDLTTSELERLIAGYDVEQVERAKQDFEKSEVLLDVENVKGAILDDVSFRIKKGEIVGVVGFPGSGARRMCRSLYGLDNVRSGTTVIDGEEVNSKSPQEALKKGICYVTNDRHAEGIVQGMSVKENISLSILNKLTKNNKVFLDKKKENEVAYYYYDKLKIKTLSLNQQIKALSGGNQQKAVVSKILSCNPKLLILDEPTIGIDIISREEILFIVDEISRKGVSVMYLTNDYDELLRISDRLLFFRDGKITHDMKNENLKSEDLIRIRDN